MDISVNGEINVDILQVKFILKSIILNVQANTKRASERQWKNRICNFASVE